MSLPEKHLDASKELFQAAIKREALRLEEYFLWLEAHMPKSFFEEVDQEKLWQITQSLMSLNTHDFFSQIHLKQCAIVLCLDTPDADLLILKKYRVRGIKNYRSFVSNTPPPFGNLSQALRVTIMTFTGYPETFQSAQAMLPKQLLEEAFQAVREKHPEFAEETLQALLEAMGPRFLRSMTKDRLVMALEVFLQAKNSDCCQYKVRKNEDWKSRKEVPSLQIVLAWKNVPKHNFLFRLATVIFRHGLSLKKVNAAYIDPYGKNNTLILSLGLHSRDEEKAAWEAADIEDLIREITSLKYFEGLEEIEKVFVDSGLISGNLGNLLKVFTYFIHQVLLQDDLNLYSLPNIEEGLCRHPDLSKMILGAFEAKFHPTRHSLEKFEKIKTDFFELIHKLDTGNDMNDTRRKNILIQGMHAVEYILKTNFYTAQKTAFSFRLDPGFMNQTPYEAKEKFPEIPFAIFFMKGMNYVGFHIRFKDLARGGLRTVIPRNMEQMIIERNNVFSECYGLAYTQQKKNKDIPEGGAKGVIFLEPYERLNAEAEIYKKELEEASFSEKDIIEKLAVFYEEQKTEYLYQTQRSYVESFMTLINGDEMGHLKTKDILDYWKKPEYIYLGPDENMHNAMIVWIAEYSLSQGYKPGSCFISSKPGAGINHKEFGVTSFGVNEYMEQVLHFMGIDPHKDPFTIKISGGPDGDVAGNQIFNLFRFYPKTAKLLAITDVSGTIFDPQGLDLEEMVTLFRESKPLRFYPPEKLNDGGFLLDLHSKRKESAYAQTTLLSKKTGGKIVQEWISGNEMNHLYRHNVHQTKTDVFIPGGGRPRTLNDTNFADFLDEKGQPTSKAIIEGANLYLTPWARNSLEKLGVLIIKDSSANKGGVICSSFEVLSGLVLTEQEFLQNKDMLAKEFLEIIRNRSKDEAQLLLKTFKETGTFLTELSDKTSARINAYKYQILDCLLPLELPNDPSNPMIRCLLQYCPKFLRENYQDKILTQIPDIHKKAIIACYLGSQIVYKKGLSWNPGINEILPLLIQDIHWLKGD